MNWVWPVAVLIGRMGWISMYVFDRSDATIFGSLVTVSISTTSMRLRSREVRLKYSLLPSIASQRDAVSCFSRWMFVIGAVLSAICWSLNASVLILTPFFDAMSNTHASACG